MMSYFFFCFLLKWDPFKKNTNLASRVNSTRLHIHKSFQFDMTLPCYTEVVPTWHDFCHVIFLYFLKILLFIYWVVSYVMLKINLIHNFLRVLVLRKKNWIIVYGSCLAPLNIKISKKLHT